MKLSFACGRGSLMVGWTLVLFWILFLELELEWALLASVETCYIT